MSYKVLRTIGVILFALYVLGIAGAVIFWFMHYYAMQEGYLGFGDSLMIGCVICGVFAVVGQLGLPLIIISFIVKSQQSKRNETKNQAVSQPTSQYASQPIEQSASQPAMQPLAQQNQQPVTDVKTQNRCCSMCGAEISIHASFCPYCGNKLS